MNWFQEVLKRKDDLLLDLTNLLKIESTKDLETASPAEPMGKNIAKALDYMLTLSDQQGFYTKNHEGFYGFAEFGTSNSEHIAVLCHIDVVPATGQWTSPPFEPTIREGKLYARGAIDDKGPTMAAFYAVKVLNELQLPLKRNVRIIFGTDEESGMSCMKKYREVEERPIAGFAPDATFPIINAEKGQIHVKCVMNYRSEPDHSSSSPFTLFSFTSGTRANMVPETATATICGDVTTIAEKFTSFLESYDLNGESTTDHDKLRLELKGVSAHSMEPFKGINAAVYLAHFLSTFEFDQNGKEYLSFISDTFYEDHYGKVLGIAHTDEITGPLTVNPAIFHYEPGAEGTVQLNIRYPVTGHFETIEREIKNTLDTSLFTISEIRNKNPHHVDKDTAMIRSLQQAYQEETGEEPTLLSSGGNTYASLLPNCVAYGAVFPGKVMTAHQKDEYIEVEDLLRATAIYAKAIYYLANMES
ncbi:dipeptidase PepV [Alkalihalobacterium elongatum]|uniref:dipeptidase PepV n=1 Tax=Alkalihalobacterium elongatum TaxID=2675466 RepID=UPI001C1FA8A6|nr:dipeptidase PepV [Alkalihalobacterium elongatum]